MKQKSLCPFPGVATTGLFLSVAASSRTGMAAGAAVVENLYGLAIMRAGRKGWPPPLLPGGNIPACSAAYFFTTNTIL